ncbi:hypothetical protein B0H14DRAFT_3102529 [Mycena olivaceomarginata]|nr:hypothetical protein B0H14DRAFT_3102529 [Mycena olivaceomarginata]
MSTFTETSPVNMSSERDWANNLGMLDWDSTSIVFTKRSLMEFLKYTGTTVDTNFNNIQKLPRYVKFGKISDAGPGSSPAASTVAPATSTGSIAASPSSDFKPTRRVRDPPGGHRTNIFADEDVLDALSAAPPKEQALPVAIHRNQAKQVCTTLSAPTNVTRSRRVREAPGGNSTLGSIWGNDEPEEFKPTRRVRQAPGGSSSGVSL